MQGWGLSLACWGLLSAPLLALPLPEAPGDLRPQDRISGWQREDGLPQSSVHGLARDADGFLWLGTEAGLVRFDGLRFEVFDRSSQPQLEDSHVQALLFDREQRLWVAGLSAVRRLDGERFTSFTTADGLAANFALTMAEDADGVLWIGTLGGGLSRFDGGSFTSFTIEDGLRHNSILDLGLHQDGVFIATPGGLSYLVDDRITTYTTADGLPSHHVWAVEVDNNGRAWVGTLGGLQLFGDGLFVAVPLPPTPSGARPVKVERLHLDRQQRLWVASDAGLFRLDHADTRAPSDPATYVAGFETYQIASFLQGADDALWIGTRNSGLRRLAPSRLRSFGAPEGVLGDCVLTLFQDRGGDVWVGTQDGLSRRAAGGELSIVGAGELERVRSLLEDDRGRLWIGARGGLFRLDAKGLSRQQPLPGVDIHMIPSLAQKADGDLWVGTADHGVLQLRDGVLQRQLTVADGLSHNTVVALEFDAHGALWMATVRGLSIWQDGAVRTLTSADGLSRDETTALHIEADGTVWVGTVGGGINRIRGGEIKTLDSGHGLFDDTIYAIVDDQLGHLWLSSSRGISRVAKADLEAVADGSRPSFPSSFFDESDGLRSAEGNGGNRGAGIRTRDGRLWFATSRGAAIVDPSSLAAGPPPPQVLVEKVLVDERPVAVAESLELVAASRLLELRFVAPAFANPTKIRYRYQLDGIDEQWIEVDANERGVRYTNLDRGDYVFRVEAAQAGGEWGPTASLGITKLPALWETWWAKVLYGLALLVVALNFMHYQQQKVAREQMVSRRLRELDKLKDEFLANTSHELRTPLYGICGLAETMRESFQTLTPEQIGEQLTAIIHSSRRLGSLVNDILDVSKIQRGGLELALRPVELHALADIVLTLQRPLIGSKELRLRNAVSPDLPMAHADENRVQQMLHNLVGNAIKFTEAGSVEVTAAVVDGELVVTVSDTGIGIAESAQERIFAAFEQADASTERLYGGTGLGLAITRRLATMHGGRLWLESRPGEGSRFSFSLPIDAGDAQPESGDGEAEADVFSPAPLQLPEPSAAGAADRERVLVVDDEPVVRQVLSQQLGAERYQVLAVSSGMEALRCLRRHAVDLVLLDVMMPKMSGYEVCRAIRRRHKLEELPVIFLSAKSQVPDLQQGFAEGGSDYLIKPIARAELLSRVATHLELLAAHRSQQKEVKVLRGFLPICATCKRIRDDQEGGVWADLEHYIDSYSEASFSHGLCPECLQAALAADEHEVPS